MCPFHVCKLNMKLVYYKTFKFTIAKIKICCLINKKIIFQEKICHFHLYIKTYILKSSYFPIYLNTFFIIFFTILDFYFYQYFYILSIYKYKKVGA